MIIYIFGFKMFCLPIITITINYNNRIKNFGSIQILEFIIHFDGNIMLFQNCGEKVMLLVN